ncbi:MAG TPA: hypothetical protein VF221_06380 [Chloroflexota bacterium]
MASTLLYRGLDDRDCFADVLRILADAAYGAGDRDGVSGGIRTCNHGLV